MAALLMGTSFMHHISKPIMDGNQNSVTKTANRMREWIYCCKI